MAHFERSTAGINKELEKIGVVVDYFPANTYSCEKMEEMCIKLTEETGIFHDWRYGSHKDLPYGMLVMAESGVEYTESEPEPLDKIDVSKYEGDWS